MRNVIVGVAVLIAAAAAALFFYHHRNASTPAPGSPEAIAQQLGPGFGGTRHVGAWDVSCFKARTVEIGPPGHQQTAYFPAPSHPCHVSHILQKGSTIDSLMAVSFALIGPRGKLVLVIRIPPNLITHPPLTSPPTPNGNSGVQQNGAGPFGNLPRPVRVDPSEKMDLQITDGDVKFPVSLCGPLGCLATLPISPSAETKFLSTQKFILTFPAITGRKPIVANIPATGLAAAVAAMKRIDHK